MIMMINNSAISTPFSITKGCDHSTILISHHPPHAEWRLRKALRKLPGGKREPVLRQRCDHSILRARSRAAQGTCDLRRIRPRTGACSDAVNRPVFAVARGASNRSSRDAPAGLRTRLGTRHPLPDLGVADVSPVFPRDTLVDRGCRSAVCHVVMFRVSFH